MSKSLKRARAAPAAAGTPRHVFAISPDDLLQLTGARLADFAIRGLDYPLHV